MVGSDTWYPPATSYAGGGLDRDTGQNIPAALWDRVVSDILFNYTRRVIPLTNKSGGGVVDGDVVVIDTSTNSSFTTTATADNPAVAGVAMETIASNAIGQVVIGGTATVNVNGTTTRGQRLATSTTVKLAKPSSLVGSGDFAIALTAVVGAGTVTALLLGPGGRGAGGTWTDWTPTMTQSGAVTLTVNYARYLKVGTQVIVWVKVSPTSSGTTNNPIIIASVPAAIAPTQQGTGTHVVGTFNFLDASPAGYYGGAVFARSASTLGFIWSAGSGGNEIGQGPNIAVASGDALGFIAQWETS